MSTYRLNKLFAPRSVALVGASHRDGSLPMRSTMLPSAALVISRVFDLDETFAAAETWGARSRFRASASSS